MKEERERNQMNAAQSMKNITEREAQLSESIDKHEREKEEFKQESKLLLDRIIALNESHSSASPDDLVNAISYL